MAQAGPIAILDWVGRGMREFGSSYWSVGLDSVVAVVGLFVDFSCVCGSLGGGMVRI